MNKSLKCFSFSKQEKKKEFLHCNNHYFLDIMVLSILIDTTSMSFSTTENDVIFNHKSFSYWQCFISKKNIFYLKNLKSSILYLF